MCIAIYKGENNFISDEMLRNCFDSNPHGAGFALYNEALGLVVRKGLMNFKDFMDAYTPFGGNKLKTRGAIHFRIATNGAVNTDNTHPFMIERPDGYQLAVIHNGIIAKLSTDAQISDTKLFVETILTPLIATDKYAWMNEGFIKIAQEYIGWSKMVLIDNEGNHIIYNERLGHWQEDVWFSNYTYDPYWGYYGSYRGGMDGYLGHTAIPVTRAGYEAAGYGAETLTEERRYLRAENGGLYQVNSDGDGYAETEIPLNSLIDKALEENRLATSEMSEIPTFDSLGQADGYTGGQ